VASASLYRASIDCWVLVGLIDLPVFGQSNYLRMPKSVSRIVD
jgi:hypothetical protein